MAAGAPAEDVAIGLKQIVLAIIYQNGAQTKNQDIRMAAIIGNTIYAAGALTKVAIDPEMEGGVSLLMTGLAYLGFAGWMAWDVTVDEIKRFATTGTTKKYT
jgi:hypothetical protein